jgi:hypothetical protein
MGSNRKTYLTDNLRGLICSQREGFKSSNFLGFGQTTDSIIIILLSLSSHPPAMALFSLINKSPKQTPAHKHI